VPNLDYIMDRAAESVERPPLAPLGDYVFQVTALPETRELTSPKGSWDVLEFPLQGVRPTDDVDPDLFKAYGEARNIRVRKSFLFTKDQSDKAAIEQTTFNLKTFLVDHLGGDPSLTIKELINSAVNKQCIGTLRYRAGDDPTVQYHDLGKTAPLA